MRKFSVLLLSLCVMLECFTGCGKALVPFSDSIASKTLSQEQQQIVNYMSTGNQKVYLYEFKSANAYRARDFWVETYKDGKLVNARAAGITANYEDGEALDGVVAVTVNQTPDFEWSFVYTEKGAKSDSEGVLKNDYQSNGVGSASISQPVEIKSGEGIGLCAYAFVQDGKIRTFDLESLKDINRLKEYKYVHIIKCKFTK